LKLIYIKNTAYLSAVGYYNFSLSPVERYVYAYLVMSMRYLENTDAVSVFSKYHIDVDITRYAYTYLSTGLNEKL